MTPADLDFTERAPGRWETITRTGTEFTITWTGRVWAAQHLTSRDVFAADHPTFRRAVQWCADQCGPDDEEPF